jgi:acetyltransferase-like isoleucine patch superfamily enzyme
VLHAAKRRECVSGSAPTSRSAVNGAAANRHRRTIVKFEEIYIDFLQNDTAEVAHPYPLIRLLPGAKIIRTKIHGPLYLNKAAQMGPDVAVGKYSGMNENTFIARATIGAYCAIGARTAINPFNHPTQWLSIHEFQYHPNAYEWVDEYKAMDRLERTPDMFKTVTIGNDVWMGHNVTVMSGINVGDGAVIAAGAVVTKDVPPYAVVAGVPATVKRFRFSKEIIARLLRSRWWDLELSQLSGLPFNDIERCLDAVECIKGL